MISTEQISKTMTEVIPWSDISGIEFVEYINEEPDIQCLNSDCGFEMEVDTSSSYGVRNPLMEAHCRRCGSEKAFVVDHD